MIPGHQCTLDNEPGENGLYECFECGEQYEEGD